MRRKTHLKCYEWTHTWTITYGNNTLII